MIVLVAKERRRVEGRPDRPYFCTRCDAEVRLGAMDCPSCGATFVGWSDATGDRGREAPA